MRNIESLMENLFSRNAPMLIRNVSKFVGKLNILNFALSILTEVILILYLNFMFGAGLLTISHVCNCIFHFTLSFHFCMASSGDILAIL